MCEDDVEAEEDDKSRVLFEVEGVCVYQGDIGDDFVDVADVEDDEAEHDYSHGLAGYSVEDCGAG